MTTLHARMIGMLACAVAIATSAMLCVSPARCAAAAAAAEQPLINDSFASADALQDWSVVEGQGHLSVDGEDGHDGKGALLVEVPEGQRRVVLRHRTKIDVDRAMVYSIEGFGRIRSTRQESKGGAMSLRLVWLDAGAKPISNQTQSIGFDATDLRGWIRIADGWLQQSAYGPPAGAVGAWLEIVCQPPGGPFVFDDVRVEAMPADTLRTIQNRDAISLNGRWEMLARPWTSNESDLPREGETWREIYLPGSPARDRSTQSGWFRRTFEVPDNFRWPRIVLHLERAHTGCAAVVNGQRVGGKIDADLPIELDITSAIQRGKTNEILLFVPNYLTTFDPPINPSLSYDDARSYAAAHPEQRTTHSTHWDWDNMGLPGDIALLGSGDQYVQSIYVRSSLNPTRICVSGETSGAADGTGVSCELLDGDQVALALPPGVVKSGKFECAGDAPGAQLWWPDNPKLYTVRVRLLDASGNTSDEYRQRTGVRTTEARGDVMLLNGVPTRIFYSSNWFPTYRQYDPYSRADLVKFFQFLKSINCPAHRAHTTTAPRAVYQAADEAGVLMIAEAPTPADQLWDKPGYFDDFYDRWVRLTRNNPSIILRSLMNEYFSEPSRLEPYHKLREPVTQIIKLARRLQPDMPITFESDLDVYGLMDVIGLHYPDGYPRQQIWPEELYWTGKAKSVMTPCYVNNQFRWDRKKPLFIGEFGWQNWNSPDLDSMLLGDAAYHERFDNTRGAHDIARALSWFGMIEAYRNQGISGMGAWTLYENNDLTTSNPLVIAIRQCYAPIVAFPREYQAHAFGESSVKRTLYVHNNTLADAQLTIKWTHQVAPDWKLPDPFDNVAFANADAWRSFTTVEEPSDALLRWQDGASGVEHAKLKPAEIRKMPIEIALANVTSRQRGRIKIEVQNDQGATLWTGYRALDVWPKPGGQGSSKPLPSSVELYDPKGTTREALIAVGVRSNRVNDIAASVSNDKARVLVIGRDAVDDSLARNKDALAKWVSAGGRVVCLEQKSWSDWLPLDLPKPENNAFSVVHIRAPGHPIFADFGTTDLRFWSPDTVVANCILKKPASGMFRTLADVTNGNGLEFAAAVEVPWGKGVYVLNLLSMVERVRVDPVAATLLRSTILYAANDAASAAGRSRVIALASDRAALRPRLAALGMPADLLEEAPSPRGNADALRQAIAEDGATLYLNDASDDELKLLAGLTQADLSWIDPAQVPLPMHIVGNDPITWGISSQDLYWTDPASGSWIKPPLPNVRRGVRVGGDRARTLVSGGLLVEIPLGAGRVVIDQVPWQAPKGNDAQRAARYSATLLTNLRTSAPTDGQQ